MAAGKPEPEKYSIGMIELDFRQKRQAAQGQTEVTARLGASQERKMEMFKNMEVVLMLCFGLICAAALIAQPQVEQTAARAQANPEQQIPVVVVTGKRLSAAQKAQAGQEQG
jgi:hypothetical protein